MFVLKSKLNDIRGEFGVLKNKILGNIQLNKELKKIYDYKFPDVVLERTKKDLNINESKLRSIKIDFFDYMITVQKFKNVEMISKTTDTLWHNLILDTESYLDFCLNYVGFFVHHKPHLESKTLSLLEMKDLRKKYNSAVFENSDYHDYRNRATDNSSDLMTYVLLYSLLADDNSSSSSSSNSYNNYNDYTKSNCSTSCRSSSCSSSSSSSCSSCSSSSSCGS